MTKSAQPTAWIFDCDGVLINSNAIKAQAMHDAAALFGKSAADKLLEYHNRNTGIGREIKFKLFFEEFLGRTDDYSADYTALLRRYAQNNREALASCETAPEISDLLGHLRTQGHTLFVSSGAEQNELIQVLEDKKLAPFFHTIFGSPADKMQHIDAIRAMGFNTSALVGDSGYDYKVAKANSIPFFFVSVWASHENWKEDFTGAPGCEIFDTIASLHRHIQLSGT
jgi:phosphoglycolate phosphatase-like HAD superfamily hydrolase